MQKQQKKVYIDLHHAFGSNFCRQRTNTLGIIQEQGQIKLVYTIGKTIVKKNLKTKQMEFIKLTQNVESLQCMAISPTRNHIAICQKLRNQSFLLLNLYGLKAKDSEIKHFKLPQSQKQSTFKAIAFSPSQPKYACCLTGQPDFQLIFLDISRSRGLAVSNFSIENAQQISICSSQSHLISCSGKNLFKLYKVEDYSFKSYDDVKKLPKSRNFTVHSWFDKTKILIGTDRGELFMVGPVGNNFQVKRHFTNVFSAQVPSSNLVSPIIPNINLPSNNINLTLPKVTAICALNKGFILGSNSGHFLLWMKQQQTQQNFEDQYTGDLTKKWKVPASKVSEVTCITICPKEDIIAVAFKNNSIAYTHLETLMSQDFDQVNGNGKNKKTLKKVNEKLYETSKSNQNLQKQQQTYDFFQYLYEGVHSQSISSMDICMHRPIIATLSKPENTIRLWNYKKPSCELTKKFDSKTDGIEQNPILNEHGMLNQSIVNLQSSASKQLLVSLALHPLGYYMAVGCIDKLRIYHILASQLRNYRQIVLRGVCQLKFSNGGQYLAAAYPRQKYNIHQINIYNSYTLQQIGRLSDHSHIITELCWKSNDRTLISVGLDGTVAEWRQPIVGGNAIGNNLTNAPIKQSQSNAFHDVAARDKEWTCKKYTQNNSRYSSVLYDRNMKSVLVSGVEAGKPVIRQIRSEKELVQKVNNVAFRVSQLCWLTSQWNVPAIIAGTQDGYIKVYNSGFDNIVEQSLNIHTSAVTKIQTSPCGRYVFTVGDDGNLFVHQVSLTNRDGFINKRLHDSVNEYELNPLVGVLDDQLADIVLVQRNDINEKIRYIRFLQKSLEEMKRKIVIQDQQDKKKHQGKLSDITKEKQTKIDDLSQELQRLKNKKKDLEVSTQAGFLDVQNKNLKMLQQIQILYEKKLALQNKKYFQMQQTFEKLRKQQEMQKNHILQSNQQSIVTLKQSFIDYFKKAEKIHESKQNQVFEGEKLFTQKVNQIQEEHQEELRKLSHNLINLQQQKSQKTAEYITSIESLKRQCKILHDQIVQFMSDNDRTSQFINELRSELQNIKNCIKQKMLELEQKQQNLKQREQKITAHQERIGDLQKKKEVLSYRIWQMRQQIEPKQDEIDFLKEELYNLEQEFQNLLNQQKIRKEVQNKIKRDKQFFTKKLSQQKMMTKEKQSKFKKLCSQITKIVESKNSDKKYYEDQMSHFYKKYQSFMTDSVRINQSSKGIDQMTRHMEHLDKQINLANQITDKKKLRRDQEIQKATLENATLIKKLGEFRDDKQKLLSELKNAQKIVDSLKRQTTQIRNSTLFMSSNQKISGSVGFSGLTKKASLKQISPHQRVQNAHSQYQPQQAFHMIRSSSQPLKKGKIAKGLNYDNESLSIFARAKLKELQSRLENTKMQFRQKQMYLKILKQKVIDHVMRQNCGDPHLEKCLSQYQI